MEMSVVTGRAKWQRVNPAGLLMLGQKGGVMLMAVAAKKHVTVFPRSRQAKGAGRLEVKNAFRAAAKGPGSLGEPDRGKRNQVVAAAVRAAGLKTGVFHRKSRACPRSPLFGKVYTLGRGSPE